MKTLVSNLYESMKQMRDLVFGTFFAIVMNNAFALPDGFVYIDESVPGIRLDTRYAGSNNFVGRPIIG